MSTYMHQIMNHLNSEKGSAVVIVIVITVILFIALTAGIFLVGNQTKLVSGSKRKTEAFAIAEAGLDAAIWKLERNQELNVGTFIDYNSQGKYTVTVTIPGLAEGNTYRYVISSLGEHTSTGVKKKIEQDVYYINLSRAVFSYSGTNGGGQVAGSVNIRGPFYTSGNLNLNGNVGIYNLDNTSGNPIMVRGNLTIGSNGVNIGGNSAQTGINSPMAVFVKGTIDRPNQVFNVVSRQVPEVSLPDIVKTQYLDAASGNDNAVYVGDLTLGTVDVQIGPRGDGTYSFNYDYQAGANTPDVLTTEGTVYIDGNLTFDKKVNYNHGSYNGTSFTKSTVFTVGKLTINKEIRSLGTYPTNSVLAFIGEDTSNTDDVFIDVSTGASNPPLVQAFLYSGGQITINKKVKVQGSVMTRLLWLNNVPDLEAPPESVTDNYPYLFPGKDLAFIATTNWREVSAE